jgi:hypothetical protein
MLISSVIGAFSGIAGLYLSYYVNVASGPAVVLVASALFLVAFLFAPGRGVIWSLVLPRRRFAAAEAQGTNESRSS